MSATIMVADRPAFAANDMWSGTQAEKAAACQTYLAYAGPYEIQDDREIHHIETSLFPNWTGTTQERLFTLAGDLLTLTTLPISFEGTIRVGRVVWERMDPGQGGDRAAD